MKKVLFGVFAIAFAGVMVSCDKIDNGCKCTAKYDNGDSETETVTKADIDAANKALGWDVKTCKAYAAKAKAYYNDHASSKKLTSLTCKAKK